MVAAGVHIVRTTSRLPLFTKRPAMRETPAILAETMAEAALR